MTRREFLETWHGRMKGMPVAEFDRRYALLQEAVATFSGERSEEEQAALMEMREEVEDSIDYLEKTTQQDNAIAFWRPSLEQALVLNAWAPWAKEAFQDVSAERVPDWIDYDGGYRSVGNYGCNRGAGKTCASIFDTLLWILPNDPSWRMYEWMEDRSSSGELLSKAKYRILPRPDWEAWHKRGRVRYNGVDAPPKGACDIWHGCGRADDWHTKLWLEYRRWMPSKYIGIRSDGGKAVFKLELRFETIFGHNVIGKSMSADDDAWAGKACWRLNVDEGITQGLFREGMTRIVAGGYFHQAYTPVDPANIGEKSAVAKKIFQVAPGFELVGKTKFFYRFRIEDSSFLPQEQIKDNMRRWSGMGAEGEARAHGGFFDSSPVVFTNFKRDFHVLPWHTADVVRAINGEGDDELLDIFYRANIIRGFDEGLSHPSACTWTALLRTGESVFIREWQKTGVSISQRVEAIIDLSGNKRIEIKSGQRRTVSEEEEQAFAELYGESDNKRERLTGVRTPRFREQMVREYIRKTFADPKLFKRDPNYPLDDWSQNYIRAGLKIEKALMMGPASRCDYLNEMFRPDPTRKHLNKAMGGNGCRAYVLRDCPILIERFENYLHDQRRDGSFTGQPVDEEDDQIDSACYSVIDNLKWTDPAELQRRRGTPSIA